jgi:hypothetical protein
MKRIFLALSFLLFTSTQLLAQKGQVSLSAGPLVSFPVDRFGDNTKTGFGLEVNGQYGVSPKSSLIAQAALINYSAKVAYADTIQSRFSVLNLNGGYRYQFGASGIYVNGLVGAELDLSDGFASIAFTLGGGKRFTFNNGRQLDVGVDYLSAGVWVNALNLKVALLLFKRQLSQE